MPYAVVQKTLDRPPVERLQNAFRRVPGLTPADAHGLGNDAFGILVKQFPYERAYALQVALKGEGIETEVVDERRLPRLPPIKFLRCADCLTEHFLVYDPLGRSVPVEWGHVMLVAAGGVRVTEQIRVRTLRAPAGDGLATWLGPPRFPGVPREPELEIYHREAEREECLADVVLSGAVLRYRIEAARFNFSYLADRRTGDVEADFASLVRDLCRLAPRATTNRGAASLRDQAGPLPAYPTRNAFEEEITWLLWQSRRADSA